jgi:hypothetical protein
MMKEPRWNFSRWRLHISGTFAMRAASFMCPLQGARSEGQCLCGLLVVAAKGFPKLGDSRPERACCAGSVSGCASNSRTHDRLKLSGQHSEHSTTSASWSGGNLLDHFLQLQFVDNRFAQLIVYLKVGVVVMS